MTGAADNGAPATASARGYLQATLPAVYRDAPNGRPALAVRIAAGVERVLDPVVALLDNLAAHFDPRLAPEEVVDGLGAALGLRAQAGLPLAARRRLVEHAVEIGARHGTRGGAERLLALAFEDGPWSVDDTGAATWGRDPAALPDAEEPAFTVRCDPGLDAERRRAIDRLMATQRPAHVAYRPVGEDSQEGAPEDRGRAAPDREEGA